MVWQEALELLPPCDPEITIPLPSHALNGRPEEVSLELVFEMVALLVTDLKGWSTPS